MQNIESYFTKTGWKKDLEETKNDFCNIGQVCKECLREGAIKGISTSVGYSLAMTVNHYGKFNFQHPTDYLGLTLLGAIPTYVVLESCFGDWNKDENENNKKKP